MNKTNRKHGKRFARILHGKGNDSAELDSVYFLKLTLFLIIGSQWVYLADSDGTTLLSLPIGLLVGVLFAAHDHFQIDRKIEYAILLAAMFIGFWTQAGVYVRL